MTSNSGSGDIPSHITPDRFHMDQVAVTIHRGEVSELLWRGLGDTVEAMRRGGAVIVYGDGVTPPPPAMRVTTNFQGFLEHAGTDLARQKIAGNAYDRLIESFHRQQDGRRSPIERRLPPIFFGVYPVGANTAWDRGTVSQLDVESLMARVRVIDTFLAEKHDSDEGPLNIYRSLGRLVGPTVVDFWRSLAADAISKADAAEQAAQAEQTEQAEREEQNKQT